MNSLERLAWTQPALFVSVLLVPTLQVPGLGFGPALVLGLALVAALVEGPIRGRSGRLSLVLAVALGLTLAWAWRSGPPAPARWPFLPQGEVAGEGAVTGEAPLGRTGLALFRFRIDRLEGGDWVGRAAAEVTVVGWRGASPAVGSRWRWRGEVSEDRQTLFWADGRALGWSPGLWELRARARAGLAERLTPLGPAPAALAEALLIGAVDDLTPAEKASFRQAGCSHVLALSGMHLGLLALVLGAGLRGRAPPALVFVVTQAVLAAFCFLAGPIPSLWRAWVMAALAGAWGLGRQPVPPRELLAQSYLATAFLWPPLVTTLSFQLSFLALGGLFLWSAPAERALRPILGRWLAGQLAPSAAALAATLPLTLALFGQARWIGLVATPPLVFLTTAFLGASALFVLVASVVPGLELGWAAPAFQAVYDATFAVTGAASAVPGLEPGVAWALLGVGGLGAGLIFHYNRGHRRASLPVSLNYDSPASLQAFLDDRGYNALKRWGQNFLINAGARRQILAALELAPGEPVWEVGPGLGALTHHLVADGHPLTVFEIDPGYAAFLRDEFGEAPAGFQLVEGDVVKTWKTQPLSGVKCVGNLPYNAASAIVADFVEGGFFPEVFVVTVQLEMAQRMTATPGNKNYSSFSVLCQSAFVLNDVVTLKPGSFYPAPEVTSRVVRLKPHRKFPGLDHRRFSIFVRECFSSRRKTLRNNLPGAASALKVSDAALTAAFAAEGIDLGLRAETLAVERFVGVFLRLELPVPGSELS